MTTEITDPKATLAELRNRLGRGASLPRPRDQGEGAGRRSGSGPQAPDLWDDQNEARIVSQRLARYEGLFDMVSGLTAKIDDAEVLLELADEAGDDVARKEALEELGEVTGELDALELESLYFDEYDEARRHPQRACRRRRGRCPGLGRDAGPDVSALPHRLRVHLHGRGSHRRRRGGHQVGHLLGQGRSGVRDSGGGDEECIVWCGSAPSTPRPAGTPPSPESSSSRISATRPRWKSTRTTSASTPIARRERADST